MVVLQSLHRKWGNSSIHYPVMTLLFLKRLNDTFEENAEKLIQDGKSKKEAYGNKNRHYFFVPEEARWSVLSTASENIGEKVDHVCRIIERENPDLDGVLTNTLDRIVVERPLKKQNLCLDKGYDFNKLVAIL